MKTIRILPVGANSYDVVLDGVNISKYVTGLSIVMKAGKQVQIRLDLIPLTLEIPENILATIRTDETADGT